MLLPLRAIIFWSGRIHSWPTVNLCPAVATTASSPSCYPATVRGHGLPTRLSQPHFRQGLWPKMPPQKWLLQANNGPTWLFFQAASRPISATGPPRASNSSPRHPVLPQPFPEAKAMDLTLLFHMRLGPVTGKMG